MKKFVKFFIVLLVLVTLMFAEYRYIMTNIKPYVGANNTVYLEVFGQVDKYCADSYEVLIKDQLTDIEYVD